MPAGWPPQQPSLSWKVGHSLWLLVPIVGCGCFGGIAFLILGMRARRLDWWIPGLVYLLVSVSAFGIVDSGSETQTTRDDIGASLVLLAWLACIVHACLINGAWLRFLAARRTAPAAWHPAAGYPAAAYPAAGYPAAAHPSTAYPAPATAAMPTQVIDVNYAPAEALATLPGLDYGRAAAIVAAREARGGFGSVSDFAATAGLSQQEFGHLSGYLQCTPRQRPWWE